MNLVVGATGILGMQIVTGLARAGRPVRALVRSTSDPAKVAALREAGAELATGDLKDPASLARACAGATTVTLTATATLSRADGDSIETVDHQGNLALVEAAKAAGVEHVVYVSFPHHAIDFPLQAAKQAVEAALKASGMAYTILQPPHFWEIWCSPALGFDVAGGKARIFGTGEGKNSWISLFDVAKAALAALEKPEARNQIIGFGGPEPLSQLEIVQRFEAATGRTFELEKIPAEALRAQLGTGSDLERSFAGLMLVTGEGGWVFDPGLVRTVLGIELTPFSSFVAHATAAK